MGVFQNNLMGAAAAAASAGGAGFYTHQIANSARFTGSGTMSRTAGTPTNVDKFTISCWVKGHKLGTATNFVFGYEDNLNYQKLAFNSSDKLELHEQRGSGDSNGLRTVDQVFRDPAAWMHVVWVYDSGNATEADREIFYVNGTRLSDVEGWDGGYPTQNRDSVFNKSGATQHIGSASSYYGNYFQGYMAEVVFNDGQAYAASDYGETKNGVWIPKDPSGLTFGNNGFYLNFASSSDMGNDVSGNNNDFSESNVDPHDQMLDSPTFGNEGSANFPIINMLDPTVDASAISNGNLQITEGNQRGGKATFAVPLTGKWYWEAYCYADTAQEMWNGITGITTNSSGDGRGGSSNSNTYGASWSQYSGSNYFIRKYIAGTESAESGSFGTTKHTILGIAINRDDNEAKFYKDNALQFTATISATQEYFPAGGMGGGTNATTIQVWNFGQDGTFAGEKTAQGNADGNGYGNFYYSPPTGHLALCTGNLPIADEIDPAQTDDNYPQKLFDAKLYTGDGGSSTGITGVGFQPDFVWIKRRNASENHNLYDSTRGANKRIKSNTIGGETTEGLPSFDSDGFTVDASGSICNVSSQTYVAWNWRINGGTTSSNSNGSVTSTVQVDPSGAFSLAKYRGGLTGAGTATVGHGLSKAPVMIIFKGYGNLAGGDGQWWVGHDALTSWNYFFRLNDHDAQTDKSGNGSMSSPTSTVFSVNNTDGLGAGTIDNLAYCFTNVEGYCKVGSYVGNANVDGTFLYTGFKPAFFMCKPIVTGSWRILDDKRSPHNVANETLYPNLNSAEEAYTSSNVDILSNGVKMRASDSNFNQATTFVYVAMAHNPFKYATAR